MEKEQLTKREKRLLARGEKQAERQKEELQGKLWKWVLYFGVVVLLVWGGWYVWRESTRPLPGQEIADLGREHVPVGTEVSYNSNPPTSGPHYSDWTRAGVFDEPKEDGNLVHSLEHGYVIISYNCERFKASVGDEVATESGQPEGESVLSEEWASEECADFKDQLENVFNKKGGSKLIVVPRPELDSLIALTAWTRIQKLESFDEQAIINFIDSFRDRGPEKTME